MNLGLPAKNGNITRNSSQQMDDDDYEKQFKVSYAFEGKAILL